MLMKFFYKLTQNGWLPNSLTRDDMNMSLYSLTLIAKNYESKCIAYVSDRKDSVHAQGHLGVAWIEIEYEYDDRPYSYSDICDMKRAIELAELNLLKIGVPFCDNRDFHGTQEEIEEKIALNNKLREEWKLDELEKSLLSKE